MMPFCIVEEICESLVKTTAIKQKVRLGNTDKSKIVNC